VPSGFNVQEMVEKFKTQGGSMNFDEWLTQWTAHGGNAADFENMVSQLKLQFTNGQSGTWSWSWSSQGINKERIVLEFVANYLSCRCSSRIQHARHDD